MAHPAEAGKAAKISQKTPFDAGILLIIRRLLHFHRK